MVEGTTVSDIPFAILTTDSPKLDLFTTDSILDDLSSLLKTTPNSPLVAETTPDLIELLPLFTTAEPIHDQNTTLHPEFAILDTTEALNQLVTTASNEAATTEDILALLSTTGSMLEEQATTDTLSLIQNTTQPEDLFDLLSIMTTQPNNLIEATTDGNEVTTVGDMLATTQGLDLVLDTTVGNTESAIAEKPISTTTTEKMTSTTDLLTTLLNNLENDADKKILSIDDTEVPSKDDRIPSPLEGNFLIKRYGFSIDI